MGKLNKLPSTHDGNSQFDTVYNDEKTCFKQKLSKNDEQIEYIKPFFLAEGCSEWESGLDKQPFIRNKVKLEEWIDLNDLKADGLRLPDIKIVHPNASVIGHETQKKAFVEFKDFAQMNQYLSTGFTLEATRKYIACQHHFRAPVFLVFKDNRKQEIGLTKTGRQYTPYTSAYKDENGNFIPYGGLICDQQICHESSIRIKVTNRKNGQDDQIRWKAQEDRAGKIPLMKTVPQMMEDWTTGKIKMVQGDPSNCPLWSMIQTWSKNLGLKSMRIPEDGLIWFTKG